VGRTGGVVQRDQGATRTLERHVYLVLTRSSVDDLRDESVGALIRSWSHSQQR
jgi:hypothetical protein